MEREIEPKLQPAYASNTETIREQATGHSWDAQELAVKSDPIKDPGQGNAVILRHYFIHVSPAQLIRPSKHELFEGHKQKIELNLWADGLQPMEERAIEVHSLSGAKKLSKILYTEMVKNNATHVIQVLCQQKIGVRGRPTHLLNETPTKLT